MDEWVTPAVDYIGRWIEFQMRHSKEPGCVVAVVVDGEIALERAFGVADLSTRAKLTPRHRFRVASHSKSFTAAGIMKLREQRRLKLDDTAGRYIENLHPAVADATIAQLLSHSAGLARDGIDGGAFQDRRPFPDEFELRAALTEAPAIEANSLFKYSNHGFALAGLVIEAVTGEPYCDWIRHEIIAAAGLKETEPDMPIGMGVPIARGHSTNLPAGRRVVIPGDSAANALAPATGFVSTGADLALFFSQLDPHARRSILSVQSRREMTRPHWRIGSGVERYYGLGMTLGKVGDCEWFGHNGRFPGFISQTTVLPQHRIAISIVTNTAERLASSWAEGAIQIVSAFARRGAPNPAVSNWTGRWWNIWGAVDLVPMGDRVLVVTPALLNPLAEVSEIAVSGVDQGSISLAPGLANYGEPVRRNRGTTGQVEEIWLGGTRLAPETTIVDEIEGRYGVRIARKPLGG